jgi:hypothetical protein
MHHAREGHSTCGLCRSTRGDDAALLSVFGGGGILTPMSAVRADITVRSAAPPFDLTDLQSGFHPDTSHPPRTR